MTVSGAAIACAQAHLAAEVIRNALRSVLSQHRVAFGAIDCI